MFTKRLFCGLFSLILGVILCSCGQNTGTDTAIEVKAIEDPSVAMKEVTQDSYDGTVTFRLQIPENWSIHMGDDGQILIYPETASEESDCLRLAPKDFSGVVTGLKDESIYQSLFSGDVVPYEDSIKKTFAQQMELENKLESAGSVLDYLELLAPDTNISYNEENLPDLQFAYTQYSGQSNPVIKAQYTYEDEGKHTKNEYFRKDFSYFLHAEKETIEDLSVDTLAVFILNSITME